ncbi:helix-turn-helix transcriptional regulator [Ruegeria pomeroyi]|nr:helix-turn-helix transcriptional regulator [Ruegeria pomeroyi]
MSFPEKGSALACEQNIARTHDTINRLISIGFFHWLPLAKSNRAFQSRHRFRIILCLLLPNKGNRYIVKSGAELRAARIEAGLSQRELVRRAGLPHKAVHYWESKQRLDPTTYGIRAIFRVLGVVVGEFAQIKTRAFWGLRPKGHGTPLARNSVRDDKGIAQAVGISARNLRSQDPQGPPLPSEVRTRTG